jgi:hypothetical protein
VRFENKVITLENVGKEFIKAFLHEADRLRSVGVEVTTKENTISLKSDKFLRLTKGEVVTERNGIRTSTSSRTRRRTLKSVRNARTVNEMISCRH